MATARISVSRRTLAIGAVLLITFVATLAAVLAARGAASNANAADHSAAEQLGLMTSLPIYWSEGGGFDDLLPDAAEAEPHRVRAQLEESYDLVPVDSLSAPGVAAPSKELRELRYLVLAQPRALSPAQFAGLDIWLRDGGRALIFADPELTEHSAHALGDPRRPQGAALLSPLFRHWGLTQSHLASTANAVSLEGRAMPVDRAGRFALAKNGQAMCTLDADGVLATCEVGRGRAVIWGDAAILDAERGNIGATRGLHMLLTLAFGS